MCERERESSVRAAVELRVVDLMELQHFPGLQETRVPDGLQSELQSPTHHVVEGRSTKIPRGSKSSNNEYLAQAYYSIV